MSRLARVLQLAALLLLPLASTGAAKLPQFAPGETVTVSAILDGGALALADGRSMELVGLAVPRGRQPYAEEAQAALAKLLLGRAVELRYDGNRLDRHGRVLAHVFLGKRWVQAELVRRGLARVASAADNRTGIADLLRREQAARRARRGLWRDPAYGVRRAAEAGRHAGSFELVEGRVVGTAAVEGVLFLNFAVDWRHGFSAKLTPAAQRLCREEGLDLAVLAGARLRVRGFVQGGERPVIEVSHPEQIERLAR
jgi:endonuclease YncB( thermonuclease family)